MINDFSAPFKCLFCNTELQVTDSGKEYLEHDLINCQTCGERNHFGSLVEVAKSEALKKSKSDLEDRLSNLFKK